MSIRKRRSANLGARGAAIVTLCIALVLTVVRVAEAHTTLVSSEPAANSRLSAGPARVRLVFSEPVEAAMAAIMIQGSGGQTIHLTPTGDPHDVHALIAPVDLLPAGAYRITWHVVSADGHPVGDSFVFAIGAAALSAAPPVGSGNMEHMATWGPAFRGAPLIPALLRGIGVGLLMAAAGLLAFIVSTGADLRSTAGSLAKWMALAALVVLAFHLVAWTINASPEHRLTQSWLDAAMSSTVGRAELWRTLLAIPPLWALWLARRPMLSLILTTPPLLVSAAIGHSAAVHPALAIPLKAVHLLAGAVWLGGLVWLVARSREEATVFARDAWRVSSVALVAILLVALSGVIQTFLLIDVRDLLSPYGAVALAKVAGLLVLAAFGAFHRYRVLPRLDAQAVATIAGFRSTLTREIGVMAVVILLGGLLAYLSPPHGADAMGHETMHMESSQ